MKSRVWTASNLMSPRRVVFIHIQPHNISAWCYKRAYSTIRKLKQSFHNLLFYGLENARLCTLAQQSPNIFLSNRGFPGFLQPEKCKNSVRRSAQDRYERSADSRYN